MKIVATIIVVLHFGIAAATAQALLSSGTPYKGPYKGPSCLADFCLYKSPLPTEDGLVSKYGSGTQIGHVYCYTVPEQKAYVHFSTEHALPGKIVSVFVSRAPNCITDSGKPVSAKTPFPEFSTKEGIRLGVGALKVEEAYGRPNTKRDGEDGLGQLLPHSPERQGEPFGEHVLVYDGPPDQLIQAKFYIHNGKVAAIYLSCSE